MTPISFKPITLQRSASPRELANRHTLSRSGIHPRVGRITFSHLISIKHAKGGLWKERGENSDCQAFRWEAKATASLCSDWIPLHANPARIPFTDGNLRDGLSIQANGIEKWVSRHARTILSRRRGWRGKKGHTYETLNAGPARSTRRSPPAQLYFLALTAKLTKMNSPSVLPPRSQIYQSEITMDFRYQISW